MTPAGPPHWSRFGGPVGPVGPAAAVLRARADRVGVPLGLADPVDLAAAVLVADAFMALTGADSFDRPASYGEGAVRVLAAMLVRAAGCGDPVGEVPTLACASAGWLLLLAGEHAAWARDLVGDDLVEDVLERAAWDLWAGGEGSLFAAYAALLAVSAEQ